MTSNTQTLTAHQLPQRQSSVPVGLVLADEALRLLFLLGFDGSNRYTAEVRATSWAWQPSYLRRAQHGHSTMKHVLITVCSIRVRSDTLLCLAECLCCIDAMNWTAYRSWGLKLPEQSLWRTKHTRTAYQIAYSTLQIHTDA